MYIYIHTYIHTYIYIHIYGHKQNININKYMCVSLPISTYYKCLNNPFLRINTLEN